MFKRFIIATVLLLLSAGAVSAQFLPESVITQIPLPKGVKVAQDKRLLADVSRKRLQAWEMRDDVWELVMTFPMSPGNWNNPTPTGIFYVAFKMQHAFNKKERNELGHALDFAYDEELNIKYSIHGWAWNKDTKKWKWGLDKIGKVSVSAGCITLRREDVADIYEWAPLGTPLIIY